MLGNNLERKLLLVGKMQCLFKVMMVGLGVFIAAGISFFTIFRNLGTKLRW